MIAARRAGGFVRVILFSGLLTGPLCADRKQGTASDDHWSFRPLPSAEELQSELRPLPARGRVIDHYIRRSLEEADLVPAPRAALHRQVRRLSFMLTGLPPDPEVAQAFANDPSDARYAALVERYLASPHFGERWARHWMDVVRFAETWGYEWNHLIREAWRYRDYLIRAFNQDLPYDQLIREHIAGDLLEKPRLNEELGINESLIGTAFYRFGETGHDDCVLYPDISLDVMDNQIDTLSKAFQALTVSCSRCHDHKLDAIPQNDYYALLGIMASSRQVIRTLDLPNRQPVLRKRLRDLKPRIRGELARVWRTEAASLSAERLHSALEPVEKQAAEKKHPSPARNMEHGLYAWRAMTMRPEGTSWQDAWKASHESVLAEHERRREHNQRHYEIFGDFTGPDNKNAGWGFEGLAVEEDGGLVADGEFSVLPSGPRVIHGLLRAGFYSHALSRKFNAALRSPLLPEDRKSVSYEVMGERNSVRRTVIANCTLPYFHTLRLSSATPFWQTDDLNRIRKSPLRPFKSYLEFATVLDDQGYPILDLPQAKYQATLDDPRSWFGITRVYLHDVDGPPQQELQATLQIFESTAAGQAELVQRYRHILAAAIGRWADNKSDEKDVFWLNSFLELGVLSRNQTASENLEKLTAEYRALESRLATPRRIAGMADQDDGFDAPLLVGGEATNPGAPVTRGYLSRLKGLLPDWAERTGSGRRQLAEMIAHPQNPLTARVMVNRIWHYLMGDGIVRSVDDFGKLGDRPEHPELLDYLARRLIDSGWSVKSVIREIVLSDTFRQSAASSAEIREGDPENRLFSRYPARRLEAEVIRDSILWASGRLDPAIFGPSVNPYRPEDVDRRKLYAGPLDGAGRRSLYLKVTRMGPSKMLELFNFPDPSVTRGRRDSTNVPSQALGLLNHPFTHQQAEGHAGRVVARVDGEAEFATVFRELFFRLFTREPSEGELGEYAAFFRELATARGITSPEEAVRSAAVWKDLVHTLYNLKEFTYVL